MSKVPVLVRINGRPPDEVEIGGKVFVLLPVHPAIEAQIRAEAWKLPEIAVLAGLGRKSTL